MNKLDNDLIKRLESLSRDELYRILTKAGVIFTEAKEETLTKEELLLVADEADLEILMAELTSL